MSVRSSRNRSKILVRDLQQAEDVVQEAFVGAWFGLGALADPAAFPGWFRGIVRHRPLGIYPTIDPLASWSRFLDTRVVGQEHAELAARIRHALSVALSETGDDSHAEVLRRRARKIQRFFAQPFYVAEPYTRLPGVAVSRADALRACREILDGEHDDLPEEAF